jgi:hypothetical protein
MNFIGFPAEGRRFLRDLSDSDDPTWFKPRRKEHKPSVRGPMAAAQRSVNLNTWSLAVDESPAANLKKP